MSGEYVALIAYGVVVFIVFVAGLLWQRHRRYLVRRLNLKHYHHSEHREPQEHENDPPRVMQHH